MFSSSIADVYAQSSAPVRSDRPERPTLMDESTVEKPLRPYVDSLFPPLLEFLDRSESSDRSDLSTCLPDPENPNAPCNDVSNDPARDAMPKTTEQDAMPETTEQNGGGCLIATAAYGTELEPQVQLLRELRTNTVMSTASGSAFMDGFNNLYYSFSPAIADMERESPAFRETIRILIAPMISTLSIMTLAEEGSESHVLGLGMSVIALNLGMYVAAPALVGLMAHNHFKNKKINS